jgi:hypothetical protein
MTVPAHIKKKQAIALGCCIEDSNNAVEIIPYSFYISLDRKYVFDRKLSKRYSECYCR